MDTGVLYNIYERDLSVTGQKSPSTSWLQGWRTWRWRIYMGWARTFMIFTVILVVLVFNDFWPSKKMFGVWYSLVKQKRDECRRKWFGSLVRPARMSIQTVTSHRKLSGSFKRPGAVYHLFWVIIWRLWKQQHVVEQTKELRSAWHSRARLFGCTTISAIGSNHQWAPISEPDRECWHREDSGFYSPWQLVSACATASCCSRFAAITLITSFARRPTICDTSLFVLKVRWILTGVIYPPIQGSFCECSQSMRDDVTL